MDAVHRFFRFCHRTGAVVCHHCFSGFFHLPADGADHYCYGRVCHYYSPDGGHYSADGTPDSVHRHFLLESVPVLFNRFLRLFRCRFCLSLCLQLCCFCRCKMLCLFRCFCCLRVNCAFKCFSYIITGCRSCLRIAAVWILSLWTAVAIPLASVTISRTSVVIAAAAAALFAVLCIEHSSNA